MWIGFPLYSFYVLFIFIALITKCAHCLKLNHPDKNNVNFFSSFAEKNLTHVYWCVTGIATNETKTGLPIRNELAGGPHLYHFQWARKNLTNIALDVRVHTFVEASENLNNLHIRNKWQKSIRKINIMVILKNAYIHQNNYCCCATFFFFF